ncbi:MAG: SagB/ThcOx family dehydrogenase [bacterium]|nr:SagB/ThcOx family dehydrogenase [bacterium]
MKTTARSIAEAYHELTKYTPLSIQQQPRIDWSNPPVPFKAYPHAESIDLSPYLNDLERPRHPETRARLAGRSAEERDLAALSHLLYRTNGVTAVVPYPERPLYLRAAPSAGGLYPTEVYVVAQGHSALPDGLYNLDVREHVLRRFWSGPVMDRLSEACFEHPALQGADLALILTAEFFRSSWRYQDRAYRRICLDTGHVTGNLALAAPWSGRRAITIGSFVDTALSDLLFLERDGEEALVVVALPRADRLPESLAAMPAPVPSQVSTLTGPIPTGQRNTAIHRASRIEAGRKAAASPKGPLLFAPTPERISWLERSELAGSSVPWDDLLPEALVRRRSTRAYEESPLSRIELATILDFTYGPERDDEPTVACGMDLIAPELLSTYLVVHRVDGLEPGCYHYDPKSREIRQLRFRDLARQTQTMVLGQELGGTAAAVVIQTTRLASAVARHGDRAYRHVHLDAGQLGQRLNLAAIALGLGASGIGGFYDDEVNEALGIPEEEAVVYITTLGRPYRDLKLP